MRTYQILLHGYGFKVSIHGEANRIAGFYTSRRVRSENPDDACLAALDLLRSEEKTKSLVDASLANGAVPRFEAEEVMEVSFWRCLLSRPPGGFVFYDDSDANDDEAPAGQSEPPGPSSSPAVVGPVSPGRRAWPSRRSEKRAMSRRRSLRRIASWILGGAVVWCGILGAIVWRYGGLDGARKSDCIIVLGAAVQGATASPVFEERIRHGINLYDAGYAPKILFTGGVGAGKVHSEAGVGRAVAMQHGVPATDVLVEEKSRTTWQNLAEARAVMKQHQMESAILVSDPLHMKRAMMMAEDLGIAAASSPTPTSRYRSLKSKLGFLLREVYFIHHHFATGH
jgi:uncharacterized SAM-binding protein YcdF (DUF218 family)